MKQYWFKRRRYGWGWIPVRWQGWTVLASYLLVVVAAAITLEDAPQDQFSKELSIYILIVILATAGLFSISLKKGPKPKWRWGLSENDNTDEDF